MSSHWLGNSAGRSTKNINRVKSTRPAGIATLPISMNSAPLYWTCDAMQNPPDGFGPVAQPLMEAARIAKRIRETRKRPDGRVWAEHLEFFPELNSLWAEGCRAIGEAAKSRQVDDPFAFVDELAARPARANFGSVVRDAGRARRIFGIHPRRRSQCCRSQAASV